MNCLRYCSPFGRSTILLSIRLSNCTEQVCKWTRTPVNQHPEFAPLKTQLPDHAFPLVTIEPATGLRLSQLDIEEIKSLYKQFGGILFRGFSLDLEQFKQFTDCFCNAYVSNKSRGREMLSRDGRVQTVNLGDVHFPLHPELSREPWQPHIAWFACQQPAMIQGETTVCDGIAAARTLGPELTAHCHANTLSHTLPVRLEWCARFLRKPDLTLSQIPACSDETIKFSVHDGKIFRSYLRPMLHKPMFSDEWAYGNFLVFARRQLNARFFPAYIDGTEIPDRLVDEIERITNSLASEIKWQKNDLLMLDNTRFMHGRNPIGDPETRRIYTQFGYLSFAPDEQQYRYRQTGMM